MFGEPEKLFPVLFYIFRLASKEIKMPHKNNVNGSTAIAAVSVKDLRRSLGIRRDQVALLLLSLELKRKEKLGRLYDQGWKHSYACQKTTLRK